jgi:hypothetical protein
MSGALGDVTLRMGESLGLDNLHYDPRVSAGVPKNTVANFEVAFNFGQFS